MSKLQQAPHRNGGRSPAAWLRLGVRIVVGGVLGTLLLARLLETYLPQLASAGAAGPMAPFRVDPAAAAGQACRSDSCSVTLVRGERIEQLRQHAARYTHLPALTLTAPPGKTIGNSGAVPFTWLPHASMPRLLAGGAREYVLASLMPAGAVLGASAGYAEQNDITVAGSGYVRSATEADSRRTLTLHGSVSGADIPGLSALLFQPVDMTMALVLADAAGLDLRLGQQVLVNFDSARPGGSPVFVSAPPHRFASRIIGVRREGSTAHLQLRMAREFPDMVTSRAELERTSGRPAFPEQLMLEFPFQVGDEAASSLKLPASAVVRDSKGALIWIVVSDQAVPLQVSSDGAAPASVVTANAAGGARGLPVRPEHWRALPAHLRRELVLANAGVAAAKGRLLTSNAGIIDHPAATLAPGQRIRSSNAAN